MFSYCDVPMCKNSTLTTPLKKFFPVPKTHFRNKWFLAMGRFHHGLSSNKPIYCCEDHFDLPMDLENCVNGPIKLRDDIVPHKFDCQLAPPAYSLASNMNKTVSPPPDTRTTATSTPEVKTTWSCTVCKTFIRNNVISVRCNNCSGWLHLRNCSKLDTSKDWTPSFVAPCCLVTDGEVKIGTRKSSAECGRQKARDRRKRQKADMFAKMKKLARLKGVVCKKGTIPNYYPYLVDHNYFQIRGIVMQTSVAELCDVMYKRPERNMAATCHSLVQQWNKHHSKWEQIKPVTVVLNRLAFYCKTCRERFIRYGDLAAHDRAVHRTYSVKSEHFRIKTASMRTSSTFEPGVPALQDVSGAVLSFKGDTKSNDSIAANASNSQEDINKIIIQDLKIKPEKNNATSDVLDIKTEPLDIIDAMIQNMESEKLNDTSSVKDIKTEKFDISDSMIHEIKSEEWNHSDCVTDVAVDIKTEALDIDDTSFCDTSETVSVNVFDDTVDEYFESTDEDELAVCDSKKRETVVSELNYVGAPKDPTEENLFCYDSIEDCIKSTDDEKCISRPGYKRIQKTVAGNSKSLEETISLNEDALKDTFNTSSPLEERHLVKDTSNTSIPVEERHKLNIKPAVGYKRIRLSALDNLKFKNVRKLDSPSENALQQTSSSAEDSDVSLDVEELKRKPAVGGKNIRKTMLCNLKCRNVPEELDSPNEDTLQETLEKSSAFQEGDALLGYKVFEIKPAAGFKRMGDNVGKETDQQTIDGPPPKKKKRYCIVVEADEDSTILVQVLPKSTTGNLKERNVLSKDRGKLKAVQKVVCHTGNGRIEIKRNLSGTGHFQVDKSPAGVIPLKAVRKVTRIPEKASSEVKNNISNESLRVKRTVSEREKVAVIPAKAVRNDSSDVKKMIKWSVPAVGTIQLNSNVPIGTYSAGVIPATKGANIAGNGKLQVRRSVSTVGEVEVNGNGRTKKCVQITGNLSRIGNFQAAGESTNVGVISLPLNAHESRRVPMKGTVSTVGKFQVNGNASTVRHVQRNKTNVKNPPAKPTNPVQITSIISENGNVQIIGNMSNVRKVETIGSRRLPFILPKDIGQNAENNFRNGSEHVMEKSARRNQFISRDLLKKDSILKTKRVLVKSDMSAVRKVKADKTISEPIRVDPTNVVKNAGSIAENKKVQIKRNFPAIGSSEEQKKSFNEEYNTTVWKAGNLSEVGMVVLKKKEPSEYVKAKRRFRKLQCLRRERGWSYHKKIIHDMAVKNAALENQKVAVEDDMPVNLMPLVPEKVLIEEAETVSVPLMDDISAKEIGVEKEHVLEEDTKEKGPISDINLIMKDTLKQAESRTLAESTSIATVSESFCVNAASSIPAKENTLELETASVKEGCLNVAEDRTAVATNTMDDKIKEYVHEVEYTPTLVVKEEIESATTIEDFPLSINVGENLYALDDADAKAHRDDDVSLNENLQLVKVETIPETESLIANENDTAIDALDTAETLKKEPSLNDVNFIRSKDLQNMTQLASDDDVIINEGNEVVEHDAWNDCSLATSEDDNVIEADLAGEDYVYKECQKALNGFSSATEEVDLCSPKNRCKQSLRKRAEFDKIRFQGVPRMIRLPLRNDQAAMERVKKPVTDYSNHFVDHVLTRINDPMRYFILQDESLIRFGIRMWLRTKKSLRTILYLVRLAKIQKKLRELYCNNVRIKECVARSFVYKIIVAVIALSDSNVLNRGKTMPKVLLLLQYSAAVERYAQYLLEENVTARRSSLNHKTFLREFRRKMEAHVRVARLKSRGAGDTFIIAEENLAGKDWANVVSTDSEKEFLGIETADSEKSFPEEVIGKDWVNIVKTDSAKQFLGKEAAESKKTFPKEVTEKDWANIVKTDPTKQFLGIEAAESEKSFPEEVTEKDSANIVKTDSAKQFLGKEAAESKKTFPGEVTGKDWPIIVKTDSADEFLGIEAAKSEKAFLDEVTEEDWAFIFVESGSDDEFLGIDAAKSEKPLSEEVTGKNWATVVKTDSADEFLKKEAAESTELLPEEDSEESCRDKVYSQAAFSTGRNAAGTVMQYQKVERISLEAGGTITIKKTSLQKARGKVYSQTSTKRNAAGAVMECKKAKCISVKAGATIIRKKCARKARDHAYLHTVSSTEMNAAEVVMPLDKAEGTSNEAGDATMNNKSPPSPRKARKQHFRVLQDMSKNECLEPTLTIEKKNISATSKSMLMRRNWRSRLKYLMENKGLQATETGRAPENVLTVNTSLCSPFIANGVIEKEPEQNAVDDTKVVVAGSSTTVSEKGAERKIPRRKPHCCLYCKKIIRKPLLHMKTIHPNEALVQKILELPDGQRSQPTKRLILLGDLYCDSKLGDLHCDSELEDLHCDSKLADLHCDSKLEDFHCDSKLEDLHCDSKLGDLHCDSKLEDFHCDSQLADLHCDSKLGDLHCDSQLGDLHCDSKLEDLHCDSKLEDLHCDSKLEDLHCDSKLEDFHCDSQLGDLHCDSKLEDLHCDSKLEDLHCDSKLGDLHCDSKLVDLHCDSELEDLHCDSKLADLHCDSKLEDFHCDSQLGDLHCDSKLGDLHCDSKLEDLHCDSKLGDSHCNSKPGDLDCDSNGKVGLNINLKTTQID